MVENQSDLDLQRLVRNINGLAAFNRWCGFEVSQVSRGRATVELEWRDDLGQYSGYLHAGILGALIDTACGFAAVTIVGRVLASHYSVNCLRPAVGKRFAARARVVKPGKTQVFTACELYALSDENETLVATGETLLVVANGGGDAK